MNNTIEAWDDKCIRLRDKNREHKLSILPCGIDVDGKISCYDIATPDGKVGYCGIPIGVVELLVEHLGLEEIT